MKHCSDSNADLRHRDRLIVEERSRRDSRAHAGRRQGGRGPENFVVSRERSVLCNGPERSRLTTGIFRTTSALTFPGVGTRIATQHPPDQSRLPMA